LTTATLDRRGRLTIPKQIREALHLRPGDRIELQVDDEGGVRILRLRRRATDLYGLLKAPEGRAATIEEMDQSIVDEVERQNDALNQMVGADDYEPEAVDDVVY